MRFPREDSCAKCEFDVTFVRWIGDAAECSECSGAAVEQFFQHCAILELKFRRVIPKVFRQKAAPIQDEYMHVIRKLQRVLPSGFPHAGDGRPGTGACGEAAQALSISRSIPLNGAARACGRVFFSYA
jgi:hypothetical protein